MKKEDKELLEKFYKAFYGIRDILANDVNRYKEFVSKDNDQFWRRGLVRAIFAHIEGMIFSMKFSALAMHYSLRNNPKYHIISPEEAKKLGLTDFGQIMDYCFAQMDKGAGFQPHELLFLIEFSADVNDKGEIVVDDKLKITLAKNLALAFRAYAKAYDVSFKLNKGDQGWQNFRKAIKVRDRITHPKRLNAMEIRDNELKEVNEGYNWFMDEFKKLDKLVKKEGRFAKKAQAD